jgi:hypothetical protein
MGIAHDIGSLGAGPQATRARDADRELGLLESLLELFGQELIGPRIAAGLVAVFPRVGAKKEVQLVGRFFNPHETLPIRIQKVNYQGPGDSRS